MHRQLDGTVTDYPCEESLCLLKRAEWFQEHLRVRKHIVIHLCLPVFVCLKILSL